MKCLKVGMLKEGKREGPGTQDDSLSWQEPDPEYDLVIVPRLATCEKSLSFPKCRLYKGLGVGRDLLLSGDKIWLFEA